MLLKNGSKGNNVTKLQVALQTGGFLSYKATGYFGDITTEAVKKYQKSKGLKEDGLVGSVTWSMLQSESFWPKDSVPLRVDESVDGLTIYDYKLPQGEYVEEKYEKRTIWLHHTAGGSRPDWTIDGWEKDRTSSGKRLRIGTHYVIGRRSSTNGDETWDGQTLRAFDDEWFAYHLGIKAAGSKEINASSITIELCNYGGLTKTRDGKYLNWVNREIPEDEVCDLGYEFRGFRYWEKYTEEQIATLKKLILYISKKWNIPIESGIYKEKWFEFDNKWLHGHGLRSHTQVRTDKYDLFPQPELIEMLNSL